MDPLIIEGMQISILGILVVFSALGLIMLLLFGFEVVKPLLDRFEAHGSSRARSSQDVAEEDSIPEDVLVAIFAAVEAALGKGVRVRRVRYLTAPPSRGWAMQGRVSIMGSHVVRSIRP